MPSPFVPQGEDIREGFYEIEQGLLVKPVFIKSGKSLAPGKAAGGIVIMVLSQLKPHHKAAESLRQAGQGSCAGLHLGAAAIDLSSGIIDVGDLRGDA